MGYLDDLDIMFEPEQEFAADNPVTHALFVNLVGELESMHKAGIAWQDICNITLAAAAFSFFKDGGNADEFLDKLMTVNISPENIDIN